MLAAARRQIGDVDGELIDTTELQTSSKVLDPSPSATPRAAAATPATTTSAATASPTVVTPPIQIGTGAFGVAVSPNGTRAYVTDENANTVSVIDTATNTIIGTPIRVGSSPSAVAVSPNGSRVYVTNMGDGTVSVIDTATNALTGTPIKVGTYPMGVAVSPDNKRVYVTNYGSNTASAINTATNAVIGNPIPVGHVPWGVTVSPDGAHVYVANFGDGTVSVITTKTNTVTEAPIHVGRNPNGVALSPDGTRLYVANETDSTVSVIDTATNTAVGNPIRVIGAGMLAVSPTGTTLYVTSYGDDTVSVIDTATNAVIGSPISVGDAPVGVAVSANGTRVYVANDGDGSVSVLNIGISNPAVSVGIPNAKTGAVTGVITISNPTTSSLTYAVSTPVKGKVTITSSGAFTYTPTAAARHTASAADASATDRADTFTITVNGGASGTITQTVTVPVSPADAIPTLGTPSVGKPNAITGMVTGKVTGKDADKDPLTYSTSATSAKGGSVTVDPSTGAFTYTPTAVARHAASATGATTSAKTDTFTVAVSDGFGGTTNKLVTVTVSPTNTAPTVATSPTVNAPGTSGAVTGTLEAADNDADGLAFNATPKKGTVTFGTGGSFTYTPTVAAQHAAAVPGASASVTSETFTVTVTDGHGGTVSKAVTVAISPVNATPLVVTATAGTPNTKAGVVSGKVTAIDSDNDKLTYTAAGTAKGKVTINAKTGAFTYTPTAAARHAAASVSATDADTHDALTLNVSDGHGGTATQTITVSVLPNNTPPALTAKVGKPNSGTGIVTATVKATDADSDSVTYITTPTAAKGTVSFDATTGVFTYTPTDAARHAASRVGASTADKQDSFTVTVVDGHGGVATKLVMVTIQPKNNASTVAVNPTVGTPDASSGVVTGTLQAFDPDGDTLSFKAAPAKGTVLFDSDGSFAYTPTTAARIAAANPKASSTARTETFAVTVTDGFGFTTTRLVNVTIGAIGLKASASSPNPTTGVVTGTVNSTDPNIALTFSGPARSAGGGTVAIQFDGSFVYTPTNAQRQTATSSTTDTFTVTTKGALNLTQSVTVPVDAGTPIVGTPVVIVPSWAATTGQVDVTAVFTDPAGRDLTYSAPATSLGGGSIEYNSSTPGLPYFKYTPSAAQIESATPTSTDTFTITATNGVHSAVQTFTVPVIQDIPARTDNSGVNGVEGNGVVWGQVQFRDPAGKPLTFTVPTTSVGGGTISFVRFSDSPALGGSFRYTPTAIQRYAAQIAGSPITDTFTVVVSNGVHSVTQTFTVPVLPSTISVTGTVPVGRSPGGVAFSPDSSKLYVTNMSDNTLSVIDTATNTVTATIRVGHAPDAVAVSPNGTVFVTNISDGTISVFNGGNAISQTISVPGCGGCAGGPGPNALAFSSDGRYAFVVKVPPNSSRYGTVSVIDTLTSTVVTGVAIGTAGTYPQSVAYSYSSSGERLYVASAGQPGSYGTVSVIKVAYNGSTTPTLTTTATINVGTKGNYPVALTVSADGRQVYVVNGTDGTVSVVSTVTNTVTATIPVGSGPQQIAASRDGARLYVTNGADNTVSVIDTATNTVVNTLHVGATPDGISVSSDGLLIYVVNSGSNTVSVIKT